MCLCRMHGQRSRYSGLQTWRETPLVETNAGNATLIIVTTGICMGITLNAVDIASHRCVLLSKSFWSGILQWTRLREQLPI
jgi:hypothetical protein